jgi:hypothetical protein
MADRIDSEMVDEFGFAWRVVAGEIQYKAPDFDWRNLHNLLGFREIPITTVRGAIIDRLASSPTMENTNG